MEQKQVETLTVTHQQIHEMAREHRLMTARRIKSDITRIIGTDAEFDCGDNVLARVFQQRLKEVLMAVSDLQDFAEKGAR